MRGAGPQARAGPVRWVEERTENAPGHRPGPGPDPGHRAGRRRRRPHHRACGSTSSPTWAATSCSSPPGIPLLGAFLYHGVYDLPGAYSFSLHRRVHDQDADRRLPRRRAARGHLRHRAGHGPRWPASVGHRPGRAAPPQLHQGRAVPLHGRRPACVYDSGRLRGRARQGPRAGRLRRRCGPSSSDRRARRRHGAARHRRCRPTSRCAAWRRAGCWPRSTTPPAAGSRPPSASLPTNKVQVVTGTTPHGQGHETSLVDDRGRPARREPRRRRGAPLRHRHRARWARHLRVALARRGRHRHLPGHRQGDRQGPAPSPPTSSRRPRRTSSSRPARSRVRGSPDHADAAGRGRLRGVHRPQPARRDGAQPRGARSPTTRPTSRSRSAPTSASSRSTSETGASTCAPTSRSTTAATRSTR